MLLPSKTVALQSGLMSYLQFSSLVKLNIKEDFLTHCFSTNLRFFFCRELNSEQLNVEHAMVMFMVKEKTFLRRNRYLGQTLIAFDDIPRFDGVTKFENLEQMHLKLSLPTKLGMTILLLLDMKN
jgi:hypothetical protein